MVGWERKPPIYTYFYISFPIAKKKIQLYPSGKLILAGVKKDSLPPHFHTFFLLTFHFLFLKKEERKACGWGELDVSTSKNVQHCFSLNRRIFFSC